MKEASPIIPPRPVCSGQSCCWRPCVLGVLLALASTQAGAFGRPPQRGDDQPVPTKPPADVTPPRDGQATPRNPSDLKPRMRPELAPDRADEQDPRPRMRPEKADEPVPQPRPGS